jgi:hypothetical protein
MTSTRSGDGVLRGQKDRDVRITKASVALERRGDFRIHLEGSKDFDFSGRYTRAGGTALIRITKGPWHGVTGSGVISLQGDSFSEFHFAARTRGSSFSVSFNSRGVPGGRPPIDGGGPDKRWELHDNARGRGSFTREPNGSDSVKSVRVDLDRDGKMRLVLSGSRSHTFIGTWGRRSSDAVTFSIRSDDSGGTMTGGGTVKYRGNQVRSVDFNGTQNGKRITMKFTSP